jgi:hypothetical protein
MRGRERDASRDDEKLILHGCGATLAALPDVKVNYLIHPIESFFWPC